MTEATTRLDAGGSSLSDGMNVARRAADQRWQMAVEAALQLSHSAEFESVVPSVAGGQGVVCRAERNDELGARQRVAVKILCAPAYRNAVPGEADLARATAIARRIANIRQTNLLEVYDVVERDGFRYLITEWISGIDFKRMLSHETIARWQAELDSRAWRRITDAVIVDGPVPHQLQPAVVVLFLQDILAALAALHARGIGHGDVKPSNIMLGPCGRVKLIDFGSAIDLHQLPARLAVTPQYAAVDCLEHGAFSCASDLASLGYAAIELLSGVPLFAGITDRAALIEGKRELPRRLRSVIPAAAKRCAPLLSVISQLIDPDGPTTAAMTYPAECRVDRTARIRRELASAVPADGAALTRDRLGELPVFSREMAAVG